VGAISPAVGEPGSTEPAIDQFLRAAVSTVAYDAPRLNGGDVLRAGLLGRLEERRALPLVLVTAPAGYGKTTLLAQWIGRDRRLAAWLTLHESDRDASTLADSITTAVGRAGVTGPGFLLVIDDAHLGHPGTLRDAVLDMLAWLPGGSQVIIAGRCAPHLPVARMRAQRILFELGADDLAMTTSEAASLLCSAGIDLGPTVVRELVRRTEGWPVLLELAAVSLAGASDPVEAAMQLAGDDYLISSYFRDELLAELPASTLRFLTHCSVLERMTGPLCDTVLGSAWSAGVLAGLELTNIPLRAADASLGCYRLHGLFREMLMSELRRSEPELAHSLHTRAADWHGRAGELDRTIAHAHLAGAPERVGDLLWLNLPRYLRDGRNDDVQLWLAGITAEQAARCAPLALAAAHSALASGKIEVAEQWGRSATVALRGQPVGTVDGQRAGVLVIDAWAARSGAARMGSDASRAYELLAADSPWRADCCFLQGVARLLIGKGRAAARFLEEGAARGASLVPDMESLCLAQLAVLALEDAESELAEELAQRARGVIEGRDLRERPTLALVFAVSAAASVSGRRMDEAHADVATCSTVIAATEGLAPWYGAETRILLSRALLALGDVAGARRQLADASRLARRTQGVVVFQGWFEDAWERFDRQAESALVDVGSLTTAELRVLRLLPTHFSFREIAERLNVSSNTVKTHAHAVYRKLDASSRSEAVANGTGAGLLGP
jgi:LuxR family transcriptional regulator, maltose regulon positive regulatory protein